MLIRPFIMPVNHLITLDVKDTAKKAVKIIEENCFLSLPVVEGKTFIGFLSKQYIYDEFFRLGAKDIDDFLNKPVGDFIKTYVEPISDSIPVEKAAEIFFKSKVRFLPVVSSTGAFLGILTQKALFEIITQVFGLEDAKLVIFSSDFVGVLAKISEMIYKHGANITNIVQMDTGAMGVKEISIRLEGKDLEKLVDKLKSSGINVREFISAKK